MNSQISRLISVVTCFSLVSCATDYNTSGSPQNNRAYPTAIPVRNKAGYVFSPYNYSNTLIDVSGIPAGTLVWDPTYAKSERKVFRVPEASSWPSGWPSYAARSDSKPSNYGSDNTSDDEWSDGDKALAAVAVGVIAAWALSGSDTSDTSGESTQARDPYADYVPPTPTPTPDYQ
jgi:hypothetical protein